LGQTNWQSKLPVLADSDVHGISDREEGDSEGRKRLSWIWKVMGVVGGEDGDLHLWDRESNISLTLPIN
jgi:hypothetical protein